MDSIRIHETDFEKLQQVSDEMAELDSEIDTCLASIREKFAEANSMWSGSAHDAFVVSCESDLETAAVSARSIDSCCNDLKTICLNQASGDEELRELVSKIEF